MAPIVGFATACVLHAAAGDPGQYGSPRAYLQALGLNLTERSSGRHKGRLRLSKRGPSLARRWLYFAAMRLVNKEGVRQWYQEKIQRDNYRGGRALTAIMRKLAWSLQVVRAKGLRFDSGRLFGRAGRKNGNKQSVPGGAI
jgi:transposase